MKVSTSATLLRRGGALARASAPCWHWSAQDLQLRLAAVAEAAGALQPCALLAGSQDCMIWHLQAGMTSEGCSTACWRASLSWGAHEIKHTIHVSHLGICILTAGWQLIAVVVVIVPCMCRSVLQLWDAAILVVTSWQQMPEQADGKHMQDRKPTCAHSADNMISSVTARLSVRASVMRVEHMHGCSPT